MEVRRGKSLRLSKPPPLREAIFVLRQLFLELSRLKPKDGNPYTAYKSDPLWPLLDKGISELVKNGDLIERTDRAYIVGYLCQAVLSAKPKKRRTLA
jgi:hypothetical protein